MFVNIRYIEQNVKMYVSSLQMSSVIFFKKEGKKIQLGPVVQSVVSLTSSLRVLSLTVLADSIHDILIFFAEKM